MDAIKEGRELLEKYIPFAVTNLTPSPPTDQGAMEQYAQSLAVRLLFPQLAAEEHEMLTSLMWLRRAVKMGIQARQHIVNPDDLIRHQELLDRILPQFEGIRDRIQTSGFFNGLTEFQQQFLREEIFQLPSVETDEDDRPEPPQPRF